MSSCYIFTYTDYYNEFAVDYTFKNIIFFMNIMSEYLFYIING